MKDFEHSILSPSLMPSPKFASPPPYNFFVRHFLKLPSVAADGARHERGHGLVRRARLLLVVRALALAALAQRNSSVVASCLASTASLFFLAVSCSRCSLSSCVASSYRRTDTLVINQLQPRFLVREGTYLWAHLHETSEWQLTGGIEARSCVLRRKLNSSERICRRYSFSAGYCAFSAASRQTDKETNVS